MCGAPGRLRWFSPSTSRARCSRINRSPRRSPPERRTASSRVCSCEGCSMSSPVTVDIFVEDRAHEALLVPMLQRIAREENLVVSSRVRSARGGHGQAIAELKLYQQVVETGMPGFAPPDLLLAGIDGNCSTFAKAKKAIEGATHVPFSDRLVAACPDPHVERWYLADPESFKEVVGDWPTVAKKKCARDYYKAALANV